MKIAPKTICFCVHDLKKKAGRGGDSGVFVGQRYP